MKKRILPLFLALSMMLAITGCAGGDNTPTQPTTPTTAAETVEPDAPDEPDELIVAEDIPETGVIRWNWGTSGNVLVVIAETRGYFEEYGLTIENVPATAIADAMMLLTTGQVDIVSNSGTAGPLQRIASGEDLVSFGGHMVTGAMPVIALTGTEWNGVQSLIGSRFAARPSFFAFTGAIMDLGYDDPLDVVDWVIHPSYPDAFAALLRGEVDYALMGTGQNFLVQNTPEVEIVSWHSEIMPNYSCCRLVANREFIENNPTTVRLMLQALIRAQMWFEDNREESVALLAESVGVPEDFVASFMLNEERYVLSADPLKNATVRAWNILETTGFLDENARDIDILNHINTELFEQALNNVIENHGNENPAFFNELQTFFQAENR